MLTLDISGSSLGLSTSSLVSTIFWVVLMVEFTLDSEAFLRALNHSVVSEVDSPRNLIASTRGSLGSTTTSMPFL